jgi:hypothetical protein
VWDRLPIDILAGTDLVRLAVDAGTPVDDLLASEAAALAAFAEEREHSLLYR